MERAAVSHVITNGKKWILTKGKVVKTGWKKM